jgi:hypothetical protein
MSATTPARHLRSAGDCSASACPIVTPGANQLSVAGELGSALAAVWVTPTAGNLHVRLELLSATMAPVSEPVSIAGVWAREACGPGCWTFALHGHPATVALSASEHGRRFALSLPVSWQQRQSARARSLVKQAIASMRSLAGVRVYETLTSGAFDPLERIHYRFSAPDRMAYAMSTGGRVVAIAGTLWSLTPGRSWQRGSYDGGGSFTTSSWYDWQEYEQSAQLLGEREVNGRRVAEVALMSPTLPVWFQLRIDLAGGDVSQVGMVAGGHFMSDSYSQLGVPQSIQAPG